MSFILNTRLVKCMEKLKKILPVVFAVLMVGYFIFSWLTSDLKHIEDTNGPDNYKLQQITDYNIINMDIGALNFSVNDTPITLEEYKSDKFTGVAEIFKSNVWGNRLDITLYNLWVESGNFRVVLVHNDEIVHEFKNNEQIQSYTLEKPSGTVALRIAGESAGFTFSYDLL